MLVAGVIAHITVSVRVGGALSSVTVASGVARFLCLCASSGFVDCKFLRSWSKWPFTVCSLLGKCFLTNCVVRPGKEATKPLSIAFERVDFTGKPREVWWNLARSFFVVSERTMALQVGVKSLGGRSASNWTNHIVLGPR